MTRRPREPERLPAFCAAATPGIRRAMGTAGVGPGSCVGTREQRENIVAGTESPVEPSSTGAVTAGLFSVAAPTEAQRRRQKQAAGLTARVVVVVVVVQPDVAHRGDVGQRRRGGWGTSRIRLGLGEAHEVHGETVCGV